MSHISMKSFILEVETELENCRDEWALGGSFSSVVFKICFGKALAFL